MILLYEGGSNPADTWRVILYDGAYRDITIAKGGKILGELEFQNSSDPTWAWGKRTSVSKLGRLPFRAALDIAMMLRPSVVDMGRVVCNLVKEEYERERASTTGRRALEANGAPRQG